MSVLFPFRAWLRNPQFRNPVTWGFVALLAVPPFAMSLETSSGDEGLSKAVFGIYFAVAWFLVLRALIAPARIRVVLVLTVMAVALVVGGPLALALERALDAPRYDNLVLGIVTVAVPEELAKLLPVAALVLFHRPVRQMLGPREFLYLGTVSGLVFGAVEGIDYANHQPSTTGVILVWRLLTDPIVHACWAGLSGYFLGLAVRYREPGPVLAISGVGLAVPAVLHGLNNASSGEYGLIWAAVVAVSALLLLGYARIGLIAAPPQCPAPAGADVLADPPTVRMPVVRGPGSEPRSGLSSTYRR
ncbi:PrsW family glutamic-type intramembrane protease [Pseudonocardia phyllosphaerae]|uniref:PrsW family glutamic-type intramembrane protease n=1 Tax=Pseudonocardia phyllosphaerae TaxID=3390502 RepID=UPI00397C517A